MSHILLLGAGFSRNWGGWLASEAFEYLLGCPEIACDVSLRQLLWKHQTTGGFENALAELQKASPQGNEQQLIALQAAVTHMFRDMNQAFFELDEFELQTPAYLPRTIRTFLSKFDAIFTLNQDLLLEHHYLQNMHLVNKKKWNGPQLPGMNHVRNINIVDADSWARSTWQPLQEKDFKIESKLQPFFKLHGSSNWTNTDNKSLLIMGGQKTKAIGQTPVLAWYAEQFDEYLARPQTKLMVIGYGFRDQHINEAISKASTNGLKIFVIAPEGADLAMKLNSTRIVGQIGSPPTMEEELFNQSLIGASRRPLREIFGNDTAEFNKVMRFFSA